MNIEELEARSKEPKIVKVPCNSCGGRPRNHEVVRQFDSDSYDDEADINFWQTDQIVRCQGCEQVRFRRVSGDSISRDEVGDPVETVNHWPNSKTSKRALLAELATIKNVGRIYRETVTAFNGGANILAGGGLRGIVEAVCKDKAIEGRNLQDKIDALVGANLLAKPQADLLHEERYLGNAALHELLPPSDEDISLGLDIVETLLQTIYILPQKAQQLQKARKKGTA